MNWHCNRHSNKNNDQAPAAGPVLSVKLREFMVSTEYTHGPLEKFMQLLGIQLSIR